MEAAPAIRVRLLGGFHIWVDGQSLPDAVWRQRRAAAVVKLLALEPSHRLHRERLIDLLWPEREYDAGLNNLRQALHHARRRLETAGMPAGSVLRRDGDAVILGDANVIWVDVHAFEQAADQALKSSSPESIRTALALYEGDLLPDEPYEEWTEPLRTTLRASYLALLARLGELHAERGEPGQAIDAYQRLIHAEPARESTHRSLMRLYAATGQRQMALIQFDRLAAILAGELDAEPEPETSELAHAIASSEIPVAGRPPPLRAMQSTFVLPAPVSSLVGRVKDLTEVKRLLLTGRLVTLTGPGGIGKTRLAIEAARGVSENFPGGVAFVNLAPLARPELVVAAIAQSLDVREVSGQTLAATLAASLYAKNLLLVLDNFEHVSEAGRNIAFLLEQAPTVSVLVTSRVRLRLRGELEYPVPPLAVADEAEPDAPADATALFVERSRAVRPEFQLTAENSATVNAICRRLAGLPLAIELAAARSRLLSPKVILDRLERPLVLLTAGPADLPARQQTIRATIQWSVDLLDPDQQNFLARLSVFASGWTLDAAEAVAVVGLDDSIDVLDRLESLADGNLVTQHVQPDGEVRFGMLETIREFALERLSASGEEPIIRDRHAAWIAQLVGQAESHIEGSDQAAWLTRLEREVGNIRAALTWFRERHNPEPALKMVRALRLHWFVRGRISEGRVTINAVVDLPESATYPALRADALNAASFLAREAGDYQQAYEATRASLALSHRINDRKRAADALVNLGYIALHRGRIDDARALLQRSLTTNRELSNEQGMADTLGFLALIDLQQGDLDMAGRRLEQSLAIWSGLDDLQGVAWAHAYLGLVRLEQGAYGASFDELMASLTISMELDFRGDIYVLFDGLAQLAAIHKQGSLAAQLSAAAASVREVSGIRLSPFDQARVDRLLNDLHSLVDSMTITSAWSRRHDWTIAGIIRLVEESLVPLLPAPRGPSHL